MSSASMQSSGGPKSRVRNCSRTTEAGSLGSSVVWALEKFSSRDTDNEPGYLIWRYSPERVKKKKLQLVVPAQERERILQEYHDAPTAGHYGENTLHKKISRYCFFRFETLAIDLFGPLPETPTGKIGFFFVVEDLSTKWDRRRRRKIHKPGDKVWVTIHPTSRNKQEQGKIHESLKRRSLPNTHLGDHQ
ncbi:transposon Tf2-9 polyprotein [Trichonephila clavipes]|nr:transposon Tf2-9 polyprotein [Trichonephila clavipes]